MLTTPQAPLSEQPAAGQEPAQQPIQQAPIQQAPIQQQPMQPPSAWRPVPPVGGYVAPTLPTQAVYMQPTSGQRLGLAIASLALLIPLLAIAVGVITNLMPYVAAGVAITVGLIAVALVCLLVVAVNILFSWDILRQKR